MSGLRWPRGLKPVAVVGRYAVGLAGLVAGLSNGCLVVSVARAQEGFQASEPTLKAAYLYRIPNFVEWPELGPHEKDRGPAPFRLCILGDAALGDAIEALEGRKVKGREVRLARLKRTEDAELCELLFIRLEGPDALAAIFDRLRGKSVLTVGESRDFTRRGGMVRFVPRQGKLRMEINLAAAEEAGLKISAKLLELSQIVESGVPP